jgi:hypothetical protein
MKGMESVEVRAAGQKRNNAKDVPVVDGEGVSRSARG